MDWGATVAVGSNYASLVVVPLFLCMAALVLCRAPVGADAGSQQARERFLYSCRLSYYRIFSQYGLDVGAVPARQHMVSVLITDGRTRAKSICKPC